MNEITPDNVPRTDNGVKIEEAHFHYLQDGMRLANHMVEPMAQRFKINESTRDLQVKMVYNR